MKWSKYIWLYIFAIILQLAFGKLFEEGEEEGGEEEEGPAAEFFWQTRTSAFIIATLLIILSICFEFGKEKIEETTSEELKPVVDHLFQGCLAMTKK